MVETPSIALAFAARFVSFVSPCCLPLVPGYLPTVAGAQPAASRRRVDPRVIGRSLLFVGTFSSAHRSSSRASTATGGRAGWSSVPDAAARLALGYWRARRGSDVARLEASARAST